MAEKIKCPGCSAEVAKGLKFCHECGAKLDGESASDDVFKEDGPLGKLVEKKITGVLEAFGLKKPESGKSHKGKSLGDVLRGK